MDNTEGLSFSVNAPFRHPTNIVHIALMTISFFGFYPIALIQGARRHRRYHVYTITGGIVIALFGFIAGWSSQWNSSPSHVLLSILGYLLLGVVLAHGALTIYQYRFGPTETPTVANTPTNIYTRFLPDHQLLLVLGWIIVAIAYIYLVVAALVFTESCSSDWSAQCLMPIAIGSGFLWYGSAILLHLLNAFSLPRASTPEYYESLILTLWGIICLIMSDLPILGSSWHALNMGLLWFSGGVFSIALSMQTWLPAVRERNIVNPLVVCLTGRAITAGYTQNDPFAAEVHTMLGYLLIIGSFFRVVQIMVRKSPTDNLPRLINRASSLIDQEDQADQMFMEDEDDEERANEYQSTYRQLTGQGAPPSSSTCKHTWIFASMTIVSGMLASFFAMAAGILFMGANVQWMGHVRYYMADPATYINAILAAAFLWATYVFGLCTIHKSTRPLSASYYEYLNLSTMPTTEITAGLSTSAEEAEAEAAAAQLYEEQRASRARMSLPARRGVEDPPTMRPSQYRAKRRSLLNQSPQQQPQQQNEAQKKHQNHHPYRAGSLTLTGIGAVLPDINDTSGNRQSWLSNGSATSAGSSQASFGSTQGSLTSPTLTDTHQRRATVMFSDEPVDDAAALGELSRNMRRTESGRRKERKEESSVARYYSSERNSSDSHVG